MQKRAPVTRQARSLALLLSVAVAGHVIAQSATAELVCRFTGKVLAACPTPHDEQFGAQFEREGCCEVRQADPEPVNPSVPAGISLLTTAPMVPPVAPVVALAGVPAVLRHRFVPTTAPPSRSRLFVTLRQLLI